MSFHDRCHIPLFPRWIRLSIGFLFTFLTWWIIFWMIIPQDGPPPVINGVITPINGLING